MFKVSFSKTQQSSMSTNKRKLDEDETDLIPTKKQRTASSHNSLTTTIFPHEKDTKQFQLISEQLWLHCNHLSKMSIKHIAEFAVGNIIQCTNYQECKTDELLILEEDRENLRGETYFIHRDDQEIETMAYFCNQCAPKLKSCGVWECDGKDVESAIKKTTCCGKEYCRLHEKNLYFECKLCTSTTKKKPICTILCGSYCSACMEFVCEDHIDWGCNNCDERVCDKCSKFTVCKQHRGDNYCEDCHSCIECECFECTGGDYF